MRRAYLIVGPEHSGTRYLTRLLVSAGCCGQSNAAIPFWQPVDGPGFAVEVPRPLPERIAFQRSYAHAGLWLRVDEQVAPLEGLGYDATVLILVRDQRCLELSQVKDGYAGSLDHARRRILAAYDLIFRSLGRSEFVMVTYESLGDDKYRDWLHARLGLDKPFTLAFQNGNEKY